MNITSIKDWVTLITASAAAATIIYNIGLKTGWVIGNSEAQEISQEKANEVHKELLMFQQRIYRDQKQDDINQTSADIDILKLEIAGLEVIPEEQRNPQQRIDLETKHKVLGLKQEYLSKLSEPEPQP